MNASEFILTVIMEATTFGILLVIYMQFELQHYVTWLTQTQVDKIIHIFFSGLDPKHLSEIEKYFKTSGEKLKVKFEEPKLNVFEIKPLLFLFITVFSFYIMSVVLMFALHRDEALMTVVKSLIVGALLVCCYFIYSRIIIGNAYLIDPNIIIDIYEKTVGSVIDQSIMGSLTL